MPYCEMQQEATRNRCPENTWEAIGRMVKSMALDAVALQFSQMDQTVAEGPDHDGDERGFCKNREVIR